MNRRFAIGIPLICDLFGAVQQIYLCNSQIRHPKEIKDAVD